MLSLTKKTEYGLMALIHLSTEGSNFRSAREISDRCHIPLPLLMNVLKLLAQHRIVSSTRGARGGYKLIVPAEQISLACVIRVLEGPLKLMQCVGPQGEEVPVENRCERTGCCSIRSPLLRVHDRLKNFLEEITVASLADSAATGGKATLSLSVNGVSASAAGTA